LKASILWATFCLFSFLLLTELCYGCSQFDYQYVIKEPKQVAAKVLNRKTQVWESAPCWKKLVQTAIQLLGMTY